MKKKPKSGPQPDGGYVLYCGPPEPASPGEMLLAEFLKPLGWSPADFAARSGLDPAQLDGILAGSVAVTPEIAERIGAALGTSAELWRGLQLMRDHWLREHGEEA